MLTDRIGGHTKSGFYRSFPSIAQSHSLSTAIQTARFEYKTIKSVHSFAREHKIDCDLFSGDTVDIIYDSAQWESAVKAVQMMREAMPEDLDGAAGYKIWSAEAAKEKFFVADDSGQGDLHEKEEEERYGEVKGAVSYEAGSLSPYKFVIGVLKLCLEKGLELFTHTPVTKLSKGGNGIWDVETNKGTIKANRVVLATNGYTAFLCPTFRGSIVPLRGQITAHRPGSRLPILSTTYSFIYSNGYEYMIPRPAVSKFAGDIVIGGGLVKAKDEGFEEFGTTDDSTLNQDISTYLTGTTKRYFGENWGDDNKDGRVRREWTGIMGYSGDGFPFVGKVPDMKEKNGGFKGGEGLYVAASFQGHGMVLCWLCAKALTAIMNGREEGAGLQEWFPDVFRVSERRLGVKFRGRLHTKPEERFEE
jgi:glycine/D-amino acid oxidase-like deaminating enzyme